MWTRRQILKTSLAATGGLALSAWGLHRFLLSELSSDAKRFPISLSGPSSDAGHKLREGYEFPEPTEFKEIDVLILGGGIAGLSAGWRLQKKGIKKFQILELEKKVGGNSRSGENEVSKYPWGAHYVTELNEEAHNAREMFEDLGIITGYKGSQAIYNEYFLCQAPQERLFIGLVA